jgi:GTP cyclohydrolase II
VINRIEALRKRAARHHQTTGWPFVTLTYAQSIDGSISATRGSQLQISGPETKQFTHQLRSVHASILVGIGTVLADNPKLTARRVQGRNPQPVVLDGHARLPLDCDLLHHPTHRPWVAVLDTIPSAKIEPIADAGASVIRLPADEQGHISISALLDALGKREIASVMVEGGAQVISSFLRARLVNQVILTIAPIFVGGLNAVENIGTPFPRLTDLTVEQMGTDLVVWGTPDWASS